MQAFGLSHVLQRAPAWLARLMPAGRHGAVVAATAVMMGPRCAVVRVQAGTAGRPRLVAAAAGPASELKRWRQEGLFRDSLALLVLRSPERHMLSIAQPGVPDDEVPRAVRWPVAEALEADPEQLLTTAVSLPRSSNAAQPMVMAVAAPLEPVRAHHATLAAAGIVLQSIDVADSALRGMRALQPADNDGWVVVATIGNEVCIGLLWQGRLCAQRTLALPAREPGAAFEEQLALHIQRTADLFERQARQMAIRRVLAALPSLSRPSRETIGSALPLPWVEFDLAAAFDAEPAVLQACSVDDELTALACVAALRLQDREAAARTQATTASATAVQAVSAR